MIPMPPSPGGCFDAFEAAIAARNLDAAMALLTDDAAFFYSNGATLWGRDAIRAAIQENFDRLDRDNYATRDHIWLALSDDAAAVIYSFSWSALMDGKEVGRRGRGTTVLRREGEAWRIAHEHLSNGRWKPKT